MEDNDAANIVRELETAAQILLAPPNLVTNAQRRDAEAILLNFRKTTKAPFQLCKGILESCKVDYVLFETAGLFKDGLVRDWQALSKADVHGLRTYLLSYVIQNPALAPFVRERIVQVVAIIIKRQSIDDLGEDRKVVLAEVEQIILGGNMQMQMVGCSILGAMLLEYASTVKSSDVGLPWELHFKAKKHFEMTDLRSIFEFCLKALRELLPALELPASSCRAAPTDGVSQQRLNLVIRLCSLTDTILNWTFINVVLPKKLISVFETDPNPSLRPGQIWKDIILDPGLPKLFFDLHLRVRGHLELGQHVMNCLVQLSSLNGTVFTGPGEVRLKYISNYLAHYLDTIHKLRAIGSIRPKEALSFANIARKVVMFFPPNILLKLQPELLQEFLTQVTQLTCHFLKASTDPGTSLEDEDDKPVYQEAFEKMLDAWLSLFRDGSISPQGFCQRAGIEVYNTYLQCYLSPPDGTRGRTGQGEGDGKDLDNDDAEDDSDEPDRVKHKDSLAIVGVIGRQAPGHSVPLLAQLLESRTGRVHGQLQRLISQGVKDIDRYLANLYEDVHWILLMAGNLLVYADDTENSLIPQEIMQYSLEEKDRVSVDTSLRVLASPDKAVTEVPGHEVTDPVVRLISGVLRFAEMERRAAEAGFTALLSPEVTRTVAWFLMRFTRTYLCAQENSYSEISMALIAAFGLDTEGASWTISFILAKVLSNLQFMSSDPDVVEDTVNLLLALVDGREKGQQVIKNGGLVGLVNMAIEDRLSASSSAAKRGLIKALVVVAASCEDQEAREQYWAQVLKPIGDRYNALVSLPDLKKLYSEDRVQRIFVDSIESFIGIAEGVQASTVKQVYEFLKPVLSSLVQVMGLYHNYQTIVELVLEMYCQTARRTLCYLNPEDSKVLYQNSVDLIGMYAHHNRGRRSVEKEAEEDQFKDILLLMELLVNILSKELMDLSSTAGDQDGGEGENGVSSADVCLYGLNIIMPLMSRELMMFPSLCLLYFKTITLVCELHPEKVCSLNQDLQKNLVATLELGLTSAAADAAFGHCCDFIQELCCHLQQVYRSQLLRPPPDGSSPSRPAIYEDVRPFLKLTMNLILSQQINSDLIPNASSTLYVLICCYQDTYRELVEYLIASQPDDDTKSRLQQAFEALTAGMSFTCERMSRIKFRDSFEKFLINVRGFLFIK